MTYQELNEKAVIILGSGRYSQDFEYIFDELNVVNRFSTAEEIDLSRVNHCDFMIICEYGGKEKKDILTGMGIPAEKILVGDDLFELLDETLSVEHYSKGKKIAILGNSDKAKTIKEKVPVDSIYVSAKKEFRTDDTVCSIDEINPKDYYFVVATNDFETGVCLLEDMGLTVNEDFMDGELLMMKPYSEMLRTTIYAEAKDNVNCEKPFYNLIIDGCMHPYPCCPSGIVPQWINKERLYFKSCKELWTSMWFKIFRLSMINKTYCFCDEHFCNRLKVNAGSTDKREQTALRPFPTDMQLEFDYTCNLHCPSCRCQTIVASPERRRILDVVVKDFKEQKIMDHLEWTRLAGYGDVFTSKYYQELLYSDILKKNLFLITNGVLFTEDKFDRLIDCYENIYIHISIDAATEETYNKVRPGGSWAKLQCNLDMLAEKKRQGLIKSFVISMVIQEDNYKEIPAFVKMGKKLNVTYIYMNNIRRWGHMSEEEFTRKTILNHDYSIKDYVKPYLEDPEITNTESGFVRINFMK